MKTMVFAHRGASHAAPENTLEAFRLAAQAGADGIELDVHLTRDGALAVIHDGRVERTSNGTGAVREQTLAQLRGLDVSHGFAQYAGARIPTLDEVYELVRGTDMLVNVEIKAYEAVDGCFPVIPRVLELTRRFGMESRVVYSSFHHYLLRALRRAAPAAQTAVLYAEGLVDVWDYARRVPVGGVHPPVAALQDAELVPRCHENGLAVRVWTADAESEMRAAFAAGADAVITDEPAAALRLRGGV